MRELAFVGLSDDGTSLVLSSTDGTRYTVPCDERLEAAVRRDRSRLGQLEIALDGTTPRDIQQRVRHGQSPDDIAASSGLAVERVLRFAGPVLAEREHVAAQAREVEIREGGSSRTVGDTVTEVLARGGVDVELLEWDAWRREDGRWSLLASWDPVDSVAVGATAALWVYDPAGRTVASDDPASAWLLGEQQTVAIIDVEGRPLLVGLPSPDDVDAWDDDLEDPDAALTAMVDRDSGAQVVELVDRPPAEPDDSSPLDDLYDTLPGLARPEAGRVSRRARRKASRDTPASGDVQKGSKPRAQVPSWDEILFGSRNPET
ncbi:MAG TPA: septation protein SepH [Candidatus Nanopelagicales bacterium]|jgi:hypothetical protein